MCDLRHSSRLFPNNLLYRLDGAASLPSVHRRLPGLCELLLWPCVGSLLIILSLNNFKESHSERGCPSEEERDISTQYQLSSGTCFVFNGYSKLNRSLSYQLNFTVLNN